MPKDWTKLAPEREERLVALLKAGQSRTAACAAVGIVERTLRNWVARGEEGDERWSAFAQRVREAEAECEARAVDRKSTRLNSSHVSESRMPSSA